MTGTEQIVFPDTQQEDEDDLGKISFRDAVVTSADWTVESIFLQMSKGTIDLSPSFQRRAAWDEIRKSRLIESILVGMPIPNISLAESKDSRGRFIVIDGKQRLLAIQEFTSGNLKLRGLDLRNDLNGKTIGDLEDEDRESFENSTIRTTLIKNWNDENFLWSAFYRLNVGSLPLSPQELRKALIGGKLIDAIEEYLKNSTAFQLIFGEGLDKRMRDSELVLRFVAFDRDVTGYRGNFKDFLDKTTQYFEENWTTASNELETHLERLDRALITTHHIFGEDSFKKWNEDKYERVMNRAVFDCVARYFSESDIALQSTLNHQEVVDAFHAVCADSRFRNAIERTTKTPEATDARLSIWGERLADLLGLSFDETVLRVH